VQKGLGGRLIFVDETWTTTAMTRHYAWAEVGARVIRHAPNGHWKTTMFLAGLTCEGLIGPFVLDGSINAECFFAYVEQILVPGLREGDTVILDNLSSHKNEAAARLIADAGAHLLFLPPYSPDLKSDRNGLRQTQRAVTASPSQNCRRPLGPHRPHPQPFHPSRMRQLSNYVRHCGYNPL
jgi:hypothetical protein